MADRKMRSPAEEAEFNLVCDIETRIGLKVQTVGYAALTPAEKTFYSVWLLDADVNNGGFDQYFFNSSSDHVADAARGLELIGANETAKIVRSAMAVFPEPGPSADRERRQDQLASLREDAQAKLEALTNAFFARPNDLEHLLASHARNHKSDLTIATGRAAWPDIVLSLTLACTLLPAISFNALLWYEHFAGLGIYDLALGGDPAWRHRPLLLPTLALVGAVGRLGLRHFWPTAPRYRRAILALAVIALVTLAASLIPEPHFN